MFITPAFYGFVDIINRGLDAALPVVDAAFQQLVLEVEGEQRPGGMEAASDAVHQAVVAVGLPSSAPIGSPLVVASSDRDGPSAEGAALGDQDQFGGGGVPGSTTEAAEGVALPLSPSSFFGNPVVPEGDNPFSQIPQSAQEQLFGQAFSQGPSSRGYGRSAGFGGDFGSQLATDPLVVAFTQRAQVGIRGVAMPNFRPELFATVTEGGGASVGLVAIPFIASEAPSPSGSPVSGSPALTVQLRRQLTPTPEALAEVLPESEGGPSPSGTQFSGGSTPPSPRAPEATLAPGGVSGPVSGYGEPNAQGTKDKKSEQSPSELRVLVQPKSETTTMPILQFSQKQPARESIQKTSSGRIDRMYNNWNLATWSGKALFIPRVLLWIASIASVIIPAVYLVNKLVVSCGNKKRSAKVLPAPVVAPGVPVIGIDGVTRTQMKRVK